MTAPTLALVATGWVVGTLLVWRLRTLGPATDVGLAAGVSVVIPARDEERNLPRLLASLAAQVEPPAEVIVVDDGSADATAAVATAAGATVVRAPEPPAGWLGKPWACHLGRRAARGDRLLFLDADTWLAPDAVARLAGAHARDATGGLLSVQPYHEVREPYEHLSAICNVVPVMASGAAVVGGHGTSTVAFGPCLLTGAEDLDAVGGFESARRSVVEDATLAAAFRAAGRPVHVRGGGHVVRFRMYPDGIRGLVQGWTKGLAAGAPRTPPLPTAGAVLWVSAALTTVVAAVSAPSATAALAYAAFAAQTTWMLRRFGSFSSLTGLAFPIPLVAFVLLFAASAARRVARRPVTWRGRRIPARS